MKHLVKYIAKKLAVSIVILLVVSFLAFWIMSVLPGDAALISLGTEATAERIEELREEWGLNDPLPERYGAWLWDILHGDFGYSTHYKTACSEVLAQRMPITLLLGLISLVISVVFGILFGLVAALYRGRILDTIVTFCANLGVSLPVFWLGILLPYLSGVAALTSDALADLPPDRSAQDYTACFSIDGNVLFDSSDPGQDVDISAGTASGDDAMHIVYRHLNELNLDSGRAVLLAHMRLLFREDEDAVHRSDLAGRNLLDAVILLPGNIMLGDTTARALLLFDRRRKAGGVRQAEDDIFMLDLSGWGRRSGMQVQLDAGELEKVAAYTAHREEVPGISRRVPREEVLRHNVWLPARYLVQAVPSSSEGIRQLAGRRAAIESDLRTVESSVDALLDKLAAMRHLT